MLFKPQRAVPRKGDEFMFPEEGDEEFYTSGEHTHADHVMRAARFM